MAIEDIDLMTEEEMDLGSDPEMQDILKQLGAEEAQALMQLIKEYKEMVAQGFQGEFEDFVKVKMATAQGEDVNEFQSEDEMIIEPDEMMDIEKQIVPTEMAAEGGIMGYKYGGGADWINTHKPKRRGNPPVFEKKKRKKKQEGGIMDVVEDEEMVETTPGPTRQEMIIDYLTQRGLPITPENIQKAIIKMITEGMPFTEEAAYDMPQMEQPSVLPKGMMMDETIRTPQDVATLTEDVMTPPAKPFIYDAPIDQGPWNEERALVAQGGFADDMSVVSKVDPSRIDQIEGNQMAEEAQKKIMEEFYKKFPGAVEDISLEDMVALLQFETSMETPGLGIIGMKEAADMITPESARTSAQAMSRHHFQEGGPISDEDEYEQYVADRKSKGEDVLGFDEFKLMKINFPGFPTYAAGGRVPYGLGSLVKKAFKGVKKVGSKLVDSVKKVVKSPLGKAALMYATTAGLGNIGAAGGLGGKQAWMSGQWLKPTNVLSNIQGSWGNLQNMFSGADKLTSSNALHKKMGTDKFGNFIYKKVASEPTGIMSKLASSFKTNPMPWILGTSLAGGAYTAANPGEENLGRLTADRSREVADWDNIIAGIRSGQGVTPFATDNVMFPYPNYYLRSAEGGRVPRADGGIMNLGGMEKDYRETGGFVPLGEYEKKDDVPARLSLNEFVMTADAVRGAGNGDVDKGAEVMEDMMETLEQQGQRHRQAQDMFSVSERLSEVVN
jgi:hypothetical protein